MNKIINKNMKKNRSQEGFSIIELLVAVTLGLFLMTALVEVLLSGNQSFASANHFSRLQENGRTATGMIVTDLKRAGYMGGNSDIKEISGTDALANPTAGCVLADTTWGRMSTGNIFGLNDTNTGYACIPDASYLRGDILTLRLASPWQVTGALNANQIYLRTSMFEGRVFKGSDETDIANQVTDMPQSMHELLSYSYYIGDSGRSCSGAAVPSLFRVRMGPAGLPVTDELLPGVEHFQVQYGVNGQYQNANTVTANEDWDPETTNDGWDQVTTATIWLLVRAECAEQGFTDGRTYNLGDVVYNPGDGFRRQLYSTVVMLRN